MATKIKGFDGAAIREIKETSWYTVAVIARAAGVTPATVRNWRRRNPADFETKPKPFGKGDLISGKSVLARIGFLAATQVGQGDAETDAQNLKRAMSAINDIRKGNK